MKNSIEVLIVTDATTGDHIATIDYNLYSEDVICIMLSDLFLSNLEHGILIKPGIR